MSAGALFYLRGDYNIKGIKKVPSYVLFYPTSLVVCVLEPKAIKAQTKRIQAELKAQKVGALKRPKLVQQGLEDFGQTFADMAHESVLSLDNRNKSIAYDAIREVVYQRRPKDVGGGEFNTTTPGRFVVKSSGDKTSVYHDYEKGAALEQPLQQIFADKLKIKG
jgi:hypothetical protein